MSAEGDDEAVGYGRPPTKSRFQPGQSGNPRGRRKGSTNFATDLARTLQAPVMLHEQGKPRKVTTQKALLMRAREKALKGDPRSLDLMLSLARTYSNDAGAELDPAGISADDQAKLEDYRKRLLDERDEAPRQNCPSFAEPNEPS